MFGFLQERDPEDVQKTCDCCCHKPVHMCDPDTWDCEHCQTPSSTPNWEAVFDRTFLCLPLRIKMGERIVPNEGVKKFIKLHQMDMVKKFVDKVEDKFAKYQDGTLWDAESFLNELDHVLEEMEEQNETHE